MTVTWTLKDGLKWSDGQPLTCDDFKYTLGWVMDPKNTGLAGGTTGFDDITSIDCPSATSIVYHFKAIYEGYLGLGTPLPQHYLQGISMADQVNGKGWTPDEMPNVPTSGAFKFDSVMTGQQTKLVKNPNYKGFKSDAPAHLDSLIWKWYGDPAAEITGFVNGEVDVITDLQAPDIPTLQAQGIPDTEISSVPSLTYEFLRPNWADGTAMAHDDRRRRLFPEPASSATAAPAARPATRRSDRPSPTLSTRTRSTLASSAAWPRSLRRTSHRTPTTTTHRSPRRPSTWTRQSRSSTPPAGRSGRTGSASRTASRPRSSSAARTRRPESATSSSSPSSCRRSGSRRSRTTSVPLTSSSSTTTASSTLHAPFRTATSTSPSTPSVSRSTRSETTSTYYSTLIEPAGGNDAQVNDPDLDKALDAVKNTVDFVAVKHAMSTFQHIYVDKTIEIPLYFRNEVNAVDPKVGNFFANPTQAGLTWNAVDWYVKG